MELLLIFDLFFAIIVVLMDQDRSLRMWTLMSASEMVMFDGMVNIVFMFSEAQD